MTRSLTARLLAGAALWIALALIVTGIILANLFRAHVTWQYDRELEGVLDQLTAVITVDASGLRLGAEPAGSAFQRPYGGRYWQVSADKLTLRSRSLWDESLPSDSSAPLGQLRTRTIGTVALGPLHAMDRTVVYATVPDRPVRVQVAMPAGEIDEVTGRFTRLLVLALGVLGASLMLAAGIQVLLGLRPLARLRQSVVMVRAGEVARLPAAGPVEVAPLVEEINALLGDNERMVERARTQAADLAHALKTSLQLVALEAAKLVPHAGSEPTNPITAEVERMRGLIDQQLVRARASGRQLGRTELTEVAGCVQGIARTIRTLAEQRGILLECQVLPGQRFNGATPDLQEILGNVLDNAAKWACSRVRLTSTVLQDRLCITVDDDGPGLRPEDRERVFARGIRLDERIPGSGLGLTIARELVELYGGCISLHTAPLGGLRVRLDLPGSYAAG